MHYKLIKTYVSVISLFILIEATGCRDKKEHPSIMPPVKVEVKEVMTSYSGATPSYSGTVSTAESTTVSFSVGGVITNLYAREGQKISKGQLLGKIRNGEYLNAYNIAAAELAEAQDAYDRLKKLHDANALPEVKWVEIEQKLKQARNAEEMAQRTLDDAELHSPTSGTVTQKFADVGQTVMPVQPIYEIVSTENLTIDIPVSEDEIGSFTAGQKALVSIEMEGKKLSLEGKVTQKSVVADPLTRSFTVKVGLPATGGKILPGMIGTVTFEEKETEGKVSKSVTLPSQAVLLNHDNRWFVWVVNDSLAERRFVTPGRLISDGVTIESGLQSGDHVIVAGMQKVGTGTRVIY